MAESFVIGIAGGNTVLNKIAVLLNGAGDSPRNPILRGLGMNLDLRLSPHVLWFEVTHGVTTPAADVILADFVKVGELQWRLSGQAGLGVLALPFDYSFANRHYLRVRLANASYIVGEEREYWVKDDPPIELYYCGAALEWCCKAANAYVGPIQGGGAQLSEDPGEPPFTAQTPVTQPALVTIVNVSDAIVKETFGLERTIDTRDIAFQGTYDTGTDGIDVSDIEVTGSGFLGETPVDYDLVGSFSGAGGGTFNSETGEFFGTGTFTATGTASNDDLGIGPVPVEIEITVGEYQSDEAVFDGNRYCDDLDQTNESAVVPLGPGAITTIYAQDFVATATAPLELPLRIMDSWRDEFNQKHYGGTKYLSIFEEGEAEDTQGTLIHNVYQEEIQGVSSLSIINIDPDREYRIIFRFRSELDDDNYVDKLVRLRIVTQEQLRVHFDDDFQLDSLPDIVHDEVTNTFAWSFADSDASSFDDLEIIQAAVIVDNSVVKLPVGTDGVFPGDWAELNAVTQGGDVVVVRFTRHYDPISFEQMTCVYRITRPNGPSALPIEIEKVFRRRDVASKAQSFRPETAMRLIAPSTATDEVFLEFINNVIDYKQVIVITENGSLKIETPVRNGQKYEVTELFDIDSVTGAVRNFRALLILQTENTTRVYEVYPMTFKARIQHRNPGIADLGTNPASDFVLPSVVGRDWPDLTITWPLLTDQGESYTLIPSEGETGEPFVFWSDVGLRRDEIATKGFPQSIALDEVANYNSPNVFIGYRAQHPATGDIYDYVVELPVVDNQDVIPDEGVIGNDELGLIYYANYAIITRRPANLVSITLTNGSGESRVIHSVELKINQWIDIGRVSDGSSSLEVEYETLDEDGSPLMFGPFDVPRFQALRQHLLSETPNNPTLFETGRLLDTDHQMPKAKIDFINKTITFDYEDVWTEWYRWAVINPHDQTFLPFSEIPPNLTERDISRLFRDDAPYRLEVGQSVVVVFVHTDGPHVTALYTISGEFEDPVQTNILRGRTWQQKSHEITT